MNCCCVPENVEIKIMDVREHLKKREEKAKAILQQRVLKPDPAIDSTLDDLFVDESLTDKKSTEQQAML